MKFDFTGIIDDGGYVTLSPGRYNISTKDVWSAKKTDTGNLSLRVPFVVLDSGEFEGAASSYFNTIMLDGPAEKMRSNKVFTLRLLTALGIVSDADRGAKGELEVEFEYGDTSDTGWVDVHSIVVNGQRKGLGDHYGVAVVVLSDKSQSGVQVKNIEPAAGGYNAPAPAVKPTVNAKPTTSKKGFPF